MRKKNILQNKGYWESYTIIDGLPDINITAIEEDRKGNLWFGTENGGVSRYDGQSFVNFTNEDGLASNHITSILEDKEGYLWFGTGGWETNGKGISRYDGKSFVNFNIKDGLAHNNVWSLLEDREGNIWFGTSDGVSCFNGEEFTIEEKVVHNDIRTIIEDKNGNIWLGTYGRGVIRYDGQNFFSLTTKDGLADDRITSISEDINGFLWFGTYWGGVICYDGQSFVAFSQKDGLADNRVMSILKDRKGLLWFGTYAGGICHYDGKRFTTYTIEDGLADNRVTAILEDREGNLWFGTYGGASRYDRRIINFSTEDGLPHNDVRAILEDKKGNIWFGTVDGVCRYNKKSMVTFTKKDGLAHNDIRAISEDSKGNLWFGTYGAGVSRYDGKNFVNFNTEDGLVGNHVWAITEDKKENIWFGTYAGVSCFDGNSFTNFTTEDDLVNNHVWAIVEDTENNIWFGTADGVSRYDGNSFTNFTTEDGLVDNHVWAIFKDKDKNILFATKEGVSIYSFGKFRTFAINGLFCKNIRSILQDRENFFWFGTNGGGVCKFDGINFQEFTTKDGLASDTVRHIIQDRNGNFWFVTPNKITRYNPSSQKVKPKVHITQVIADEVYKSPDGIQTSANQIIFEYKGLSRKTKFDRIKYIYKLDGFDTDWSQSTRVRRVSYEELKQGDYTFNVKAIDRDLNYSNIAQINLKIIADPRNHKIAKLESDLAKRNRELVRANAELNRLNKFKSELLSVVSHELRTPLTSIDGFTRIIYERFLTEDFINQCNPETRATIQRVKDRVSIIYENSSRLARLINDLLDFSRIERGRELEMYFTKLDLGHIIGTVIGTYQSLAAEKQLTLHYDGEISLNSGNLTVYGDADRLTQVLNNLINNAIKFTSERGLITVSTKKDKDKIELKVKDTGVGIPKEHLDTIFEPFEQAGGIDAKKGGTGLGLAIVKYIVEKHNGTVRVESEIGSGTSFIITFTEY